MKAVVIVDKNWGIGYQNKLLFDLGKDKRDFRDMTIGGKVIMGYNTFRSLPQSKPLPDRDNIILTHKNITIDGATVCNSLLDLFATQFESKSFFQDRDTENVFIIGGEQIYKELIDYCNTAYVTMVSAIRKADTYFPDLISKGWKMDVHCEFKDYDRISQEEQSGHVILFTNPSPKEF